MHFEIKLNKNLNEKKMFWAPLGLISRRVVLLEILKLKNLYKIASSLRNAITFLKNM